VGFAVHRCSSVQPPNVASKKNDHQAMENADFIGFNGISLGLMGFHGIYWDLIGFNGISWDLLGFMMVYPLINKRLAIENGP